jgi:hypothetical protein
MLAEHNTSGSLRSVIVPRLSIRERLTPRTRVILKKLTVSDLVKKFPAFMLTKFQNRVRNSPPLVSKPDKSNSRIQGQPETCGLHAWGNVFEGRAHIADNFGKGIPRVKNLCTRPIFTIIPVTSYRSL